MHLEASSCSSKGCRDECLADIRVDALDLVSREYNWENRGFPCCCDCGPYPCWRFQGSGGRNTSKMPTHHQSHGAPCGMPRSPFAGIKPLLVWIDWKVLDALKPTHQCRHGKMSRSV